MTDSYVLTFTTTGVHPSTITLSSSGRQEILGGLGVEFNRFDRAMAREMAAALIEMADSEAEQ